MLPDVVLTEISNPHSFFLEARYQVVCAHCKKPRPFMAHHVLTAQELRRLRAPEYSPDDALRVCAHTADSCHERHHSGQERIALADLRDENIAFAARWMGEGYAYSWLTRYYDGADARVDALLE